MASTVTPQRTQTPADEVDQEMVEIVEEIIEDVPVVVEGGHVPILHTLGSLPKSNRFNPPPLQHLHLQLSDKQPWNTTLSSGPKTPNSSN